MRAHALLCRKLLTGSSPLCACFPLFSSSPPRQLPSHVLDFGTCLRERGFAFVPEFGREFGLEFIGIMGEYIAKCKKQRIAGGVEQFALPQKGPSVWSASLRAKWHALVKKLALHLGVESEQLHLHVQDEKLLVAVRQKGEQAPHFDRDDTADKLLQVYTVILYLSDRVDSTAFPQFKLSEFALPEFDAHDNVLNQPALRATVERGLLDKSRYDRWPVRIGDMALFTQATMHFGTKNNSLHERMALFSVLTPFEEKRQDDNQIYTYVRV